MLEYPFDEANALLNKNMTTAKESLATVEKDLSFIKDQITTTEVMRLQLAARSVQHPARNPNNATQVTACSTHATAWSVVKGGRDGVIVRAEPVVRESTCSTGARRAVQLQHLPYSRSCPGVRQVSMARVYNADVKRRRLQKQATGTLV